MTTTGAVQAIIFDFDGLIVDTEWAIYESAAAVYRDAGHQLDLAWWQTIVGTDDDIDWVGELERRVGEELDHAAVHERRQTHLDELLEAAAPLPGVVELLDEAAGAGVAVAIASSSPSAWVERLLAQLGLRDRFGVVTTRDDVERAKPAPDLYVAAGRRLRVDPSRVVALEDSAHGCTAAKAAGLRCVVVPNRITAGQDLRHADLVLDTLARANLAGLARLLDSRR